MAPNITTLSIRVLSRMALTVATLRIIKLTIATLSFMSLSITALSRMRITIVTLSTDTQHNIQHCDIQHKDTKKYNELNCNTQ
jgi:hypothetical protein